MNGSEIDFLDKGLGSASDAYPGKSVDQAGAHDNSNVTMAFKIAIIYYSLYGRLVILANVIAEGARKVGLLHGLLSSIN